MNGKIWFESEKEKGTKFSFLYHLLHKLNPSYSRKDGKR